MRKFVYMLLALLAVVAISCDPISTDAPEFQHKDRTLLVYMVANNDLYGNAVDNLDDMKKGFLPTEDNLLVYYHVPQGTPLMLRLYKDDKGAVMQDTVYRFPERNSAMVESLQSAMKVTRTMFPADKYGLILWSHGTGWLPEGGYTKSFGSEEGREMDIIEMAAAIPYKLEFILFDACLMGCVEVAYQFKDSVDYVLSSPTEIMVDGFPYSRIMEHIFAGTADLESVAMEYYRYYNTLSGSSRSATISLVKTSELGAVAEAAAAVFEKYRSNISTVDVRRIQQYFRGDMSWFYDLGDYMVNLAGEEDAAPVLEALDKAVIYKAATPKFLGMSINPQKFSGLGTYIPFDTTETYLQEYYKKFNWNKDAGMLR